MKKLGLIVVAVAVVLGIISWFVLPDTVVVQIGFDGQASNFMPKILAILLPLVISASGGIVCLKSDGENVKKGIILALVGIVGMVLNIIFNCLL